MQNGASDALPVEALVGTGAMALAIPGLAIEGLSQALDAAIARIENIDAVRPQ